jgi:hypothetical protein
MFTTINGGHDLVPDKDEVPGSSPGRPTTHRRRSQRSRQRAGSARCGLGPRWGRTPLPAGTSPGPSGAAHPAVRLGGDHTAWSRTQPEDGSHAAAVATSRCSCPSCPPRSRPRRALRTPAWPGWSLAGKRGRRGPHPTRRSGSPPTPLTNATSAASPASRPPRPSIEPSTAWQPTGPPPVPVVRVARPPRPGPHRHRLSGEMDASGPTRADPDGWTPHGWTPDSWTPDSWTAAGRPPDPLDDDPR